MSYPRTPCLVAFALVAALVVGSVVAAPAAFAGDLSSANSDLDLLKKSTKSKGTNADLLQYLGDVFGAYKGLEGPPKPADDASDEEKKKWESENAKFEKPHTMIDDERQTMVII